MRRIGMWKQYKKRRLCGRRFRLTKFYQLNMDSKNPVIPISRNMWVTTVVKLNLSTIIAHTTITAIIVRIIKNSMFKRQLRTFTGLRNFLSRDSGLLLSFIACSIWGAGRRYAVSRCALRHVCSFSLGFFIFALFLFYFLGLFGFFLGHWLLAYDCLHNETCGIIHIQCIL